MKKLIIEVSQNLDDAKKNYNRVRFRIYKKVSDSLFNYIKTKFKNKYESEEKGSVFQAIDHIADDRIDRETAKLDAFLNGDYKKVDQLMSQERTVKTFLSGKFLRLTRGCSVLMFCSILGVFISWSVNESEM